MATSSERGARVLSMGRHGRGGGARARGGRGGRVRRAAARGDARRRIERVLGCRHQLAPIAAGGQRAAPRFRVGRSGAVRGPCAKRLCVTIEIDAVRRRCDVLLASGVSKSGFETEVRVRLIRGNKLPSPYSTCRFLPFPRANPLRASGFVRDSVSITIAKIPLPPLPSPVLWG